MLFNRYKQLFEATEQQLGAVAVLQRRNAILNPCAVMRNSLTIEDYLAARYVCRPLRLLDYCPVNDGGVALILTGADLAKTGRQPGVIIAARSHARTGANEAAQLRPLVMDMQQAILGAASAECFARAGMSRTDVDHFQCYDAFSINLPISLEGLGFCGRGEGLRFVNDGRANIGAELPCNTSGGLLSEAYMHGWNHLVEAVRQLRGQAGPRQVEDAEVSCYSFFDSESANVTLMRRA
jgi:acetyl-CoA acetyltransferase